MSGVAKSPPTTARESAPAAITEAAWAMPMPPMATTAGLGAGNAWQSPLPATRTERAAGGASGFVCDANMAPKAM